MNFNIPKITLKTITYEEYIEGLREDIAENGLYGAVEKRCDLINEDTSGLPYIQHRCIQEALVEILDLIKEDGK